MTMKFIFIFYLTLLLITSVDCYPSGAPNEACASLTPSHGADFSSPSTNLFLIYAKEVNQNTINVTIAGKNSTNDIIEGFLLQARFVSNNSYVGCGSFALIPDTQHACNSEKSSVTQSKELVVSKVTLVWTKPANLNDSIKFVATAVRHKNQFWKLDTKLFNSFIYTGSCGKTKSCYAASSLDLKDSYDQIVTWSDGGEFVNFELSAELKGNNKYVALGLSFDDHMGNDSVVACMISSDSSIKVFMSWNIEHGDTNINIPDPYASLVAGKSSGSFDGSVLTCRFSRYKNGTAEKVYYPNRPYILLIAIGPVINNTMQQHSYTTESSQSMNLRNFTSEFLSTPTSTTTIPFPSTGIDFKECSLTKSCYSPNCDTNTTNCDDAVTWKKEKSTDCDSALIPLRCVHG